ncbi:uncharacterized protein TNCV_3795791 [Trichonephila clavipes]|nr:uncharacterized protein TNCV_3795791 [Trichonephila clavipes]
MSLHLPDRALLVKLFYQNDNSAIVALRIFWTLKGLRKGPWTAKNLRFMVTKFEETGSLNVRSGRGKKPVSAEAIEKVALQVEEDKVSNVLASTSVRLVAKALDLPRYTVQKIMRNILCYYTYKLQFVQELLSHDFETRHLFSLQFLARLEVDPEWPWNILWTDETHFHLDGSEECVISRQFLDLRPPRSPDLNPCDFWLWSHLRQLVSCDQPRTLPDFKDSISRNVLNMSQNTLRSTVEHAILRFQIVAENDGHHVEPLML